MKCIHCDKDMVECLDASFIQSNCTGCNYSSFRTKYSNLNSFFRDTSIAEGIILTRHRASGSYTTHLEETRIIVSLGDAQVFDRFMTDDEVKRIIKNPSLLILI